MPMGDPHCTIGLPSGLQGLNDPRGALQCSSRHQPPWRGRGVRRGVAGGRSKNFSLLGAFLNSLFHSEHFECT